MGYRKLAAVDKQIEQVESTLVFLLHSRREIVNQYDLNKQSNASELVTRIIGGNVWHK